MATLPLTQASGSKVFRKVVEVLQADADLAAITPDWAIGLTRPATTPTFVRPQRVGIRLRPEIGPSSWYSPDSQASTLIIHAYIEIEGYDEDDLINVWDAIVNALYPRGDHARRLSIQAELRDAGAETGLATFRTAYDPAVDAGIDGRFRASGEIRIEILEPLDA